MLLLGLALCVVCPGAVASAAAQAPNDGALAVPIASPGELPPWFKYLHFLAGLSLGLSASELVREAGSPWLRPLVAVGTAAVAGVGKEVLDSTGFGDPRFSDIVVTTIGGLAAAGILLYTQSVYPAVPPGPANGDAYVISTAVVLALPVIMGAIQEIQRFLDRRKAPASAG
jgi:hypothetical protein